MNFYSHDITLIDVPDEISLSFAIAGCKLKCKDCFWQYLDPLLIKPLTFKTYTSIVNKYQSYISCILFYGGEWSEDELIKMLCYAKQLNIKTCLYTGQNKINPRIQKYLDYLKTGAYNAKYGNLSQPTTNQKLFDLRNNIDVTNKFWH